MNYDDTRIIKHACSRWLAFQTTNDKAICNCMSVSIYVEILAKNLIIRDVF